MLVIVCGFELHDLSESQQDSLYDFHGTRANSPSEHVDRYDGKYIRSCHRAERERMDETGTTDSLKFLFIRKYFEFSLFIYVIVFQWAKIVVSLERAVSQKDAHNYLQEYSIKLGPGDDPNNPASEQRGVMVIKSKSKTRARQRKGAVANWKVHCL